jgi:glycerophosphoryl diester phosphodiesterase
MIQLALLLVTLAFNVLAVDWQGHRGARGLYPENTIGAMEEALKYPVTTLELDVVISKDKKVVVSHEPWMNEEICLDSKGNKIKGHEHNLYKLDYEEIALYDCGTLPHPRFSLQKKINVGKPTLDKLLLVTEETLKRLNRSDVQYNIEIKSTPEEEKDGYQPDVKTFSDLVVKTILARLPATRFTLQSFDWRVLQYLHTAYPEMRLVALNEDPMASGDVLKKLGFKPYVYSPDFALLTQNDLDFFHKEGIKVVVWTVNEIPQMKALLKMGVDGIITDYPNLIIEAAAKKCKNGFNFFEGKCINLPAHSLPSDSNPGWTCKPGYVQKRAYCTKIKVPDAGHLLPDGKTWECNPGFKPYRGTCKKI